MDTTSPVIHLWFVAMTIAFTAAGWLAIWAADSPRSWLSRALVLAIAAGAIAIVPAYELTVVFLTQCFVVATVQYVMRRWKNKALPRWPNFSIRNLLSVFLLASLCLLLVTHMHDYTGEQWLQMLIGGALAGAASSIGMWLVMGRLGPWRKLLVVAATVPSFSAIFIVLDIRHLRWIESDSQQAWFNWSLALTCLLLTTWVWSSLYRAAESSSMPHHSPQPNGQLSSRHPRFGFMAMNTVFAILCLTLYGAISIRPAAPTPNTPHPNGYNDLLAAIALSDDIPDLQDFETIFIGHLRLAPAKNERVLELIRQGISKPCERRIDYRINRDFDWQDMERLAWVLLAEGYLATIERRYDDARRSYLDLVRLGHCLARGGVWMDAKVASRIEHQGMSKLLPLLQYKCSEEKCAAVLGELIELERAREPREAVTNRSLVYFGTAFGWDLRLGLRLRSLIDDYEDIEDLDYEILSVHADSRLAIAKMVVENYRRQNRRLPKMLIEALPEAAALLTDPFSREPGSLLRYIPLDNEYQLYSVGYDGEDDGGGPGDF